MKVFRLSINTKDILIFNSQSEDVAKDFAQSSALRSFLRDYKALASESDVINIEPATDAQAHVWWDSFSGAQGRGELGSDWSDDKNIWVVPIVGRRLDRE
jgi:hypothetical protein